MAIKVALGLEPRLEIFGTDYPTADGTAIRDYVHVDDLARAHAAAIDYLAAGGPSTTLNVGTGLGTSVREVVDVLERVSGRAITVEEGTRRPGDPVAMWADASLANRTMGWSSRLGVEEIIRSAWAWHSSSGDPDAGR
jgi:UDP-glucose 4-epimerase